MNKKEAVEYAAKAGWTQADAKRAIESLQFPSREEAILKALVEFAGPELIERQRKQAAQKAQVTIKKKLIEDRENKYEQMVNDYEKQIYSDRSSFITIIKFVYGIANKFGFKDAWIESLLATYDQYIQDFNNSNELPSDGDQEGKAS